MPQKGLRTADMLPSFHGAMGTKASKQNRNYRGPVNGAQAFRDIGLAMVNKGQAPWLCGLVLFIFAISLVTVIPLLALIIGFSYLRRQMLKVIRNILTLPEGLATKASEEYAFA